MSGVPPGARRLGPGFYDTGDGQLHVDLEELVLAAGGDPASDRDREKALRTIEKLAGEELGIETEVREK